MEQALDRDRDYKEKFHNALRLLREKKSFLLTTHLNPDGDGLGCESAFYTVLGRMGKRVTVVNAHPTPDLYGFLPGQDQFQVAPAKIEHHDVVIYFECPDIQRAGEVIRLPQHADHSINIDHHVYNARYASVDLVDPTAAATGEQAWELLQALKCPLDYAVAIGIYTAIATDTGHFKYSSVTARTHRMVAELLEAGVDPGIVNERLYENVPATALNLLARALCDVRYNAQGDVGWFSVTRAMLAAAGAKESSTENFVNYVRAVQGVQVAIFFRETETGEIKVSLRSRGAVDVSVIAHHLGGGGHQRAAGATVPGPLAAAQERVLAEVEAKAHPKD